MWCSLTVYVEMDVCLRGANGVPGLHTDVTLWSPSHASPDTRTPRCPPWPAPGGSAHWGPPWSPGSPDSCPPPCSTTRGAGGHPRPHTTRWGTRPGWRDSACLVTDSQSRWSHNMDITNERLVYCGRLEHHQGVSHADGVTSPLHLACVVTYN